MTISRGAKDGAPTFGNGHEKDKYKGWGTRGNLTNKSPVSGYTWGEMLNAPVDLTNRFTGWSYDNAGNLLNDFGHSYGYNAESQLTSVDGTDATYVYSTEGERLKRTVGSTVSEYIGSPILETLEATNVWQEDYIYLNALGGDLIATESAANGTRYFFADNLGTPRVITDPSGTVISRHDYYPFGGEFTPSSDGETHKFTGKERDSETGLDYFGARYYGSTIGRFLSPDEFPGGPVSAFGGDPAPPGPLPYADIANPQSLNKYSYTYNNPLNMVDPDGHDPDAADVVDVITDAIDAEATAVANEVGSNIFWRGAGTAAAYGVGIGLSVKLNIDAYADRTKNEANLKMQEAAASNDVALRKQQQQQQQGPSPDPRAESEHTKGARPSTKQDHQTGTARKRRDKGGEKGDERRRPPRKRPKGWKGPWPPKKPE